jgi:hypothetical protein
MGIHGRLRPAALALAAVVVACAAVAAGCGGTAAASPLTNDEYFQCLEGIGSAPSSDTGGSTGRFSDMPSPVASALRDAYARAAVAFGDMASASPQSDMKKLAAEGYLKITTDQRIIGDCRAYESWWADFIRSFRPGSS